MVMRETTPGPHPEALQRTLKSS